MSTPTLRIFLSSTAIDMEEHRKKVTEALLKLENLPVQMESFGAIPNEPVEACKVKVRGADALVVMVAHRYGWVPTREEGGDGAKSITWIEVQTALENNIPVFAFVVEKDYGWTQPKEQDLLMDAPNEKHSEIIAKMQALKDFKNFFDGKAGIVRDNFTTPETLALNVTASLAKWIIEKAPTANATAPKTPDFVFRVVHPLQPALHFRGRKMLLLDLKHWWDETVTPDRVRSLVAIGGTGKTAVLERFLDSISNEKLKGSILVWSFYEDPNTDSFLREACLVFTGQEPEREAGMLEYLQRALGTQSRQHLIVLDGLERVQSEGKGGYAKGDIQDYVLKNLLRAITAGLGNTRALITSRFKLTDLVQWEGAGYKTFPLDVLDAESAVDLLKAWGISGTDSELEKLAKSMGYHALSVSVLGSYLNHYCQKDINGAKEFKLDEAASDEPLAAKLNRILGGYAKSLLNSERDFLIRLSVFPNGVSIDTLSYLCEAKEDIAGSLFGLSQTQLLVIAERLKAQGLLYSYNQENKTTYTAHPFLREYFRELLNIKPENIHEVVRQKIAIGLDTKPSIKPTDVALLNRYEELISYNIMAGRYQEAFTIYNNVMGGDNSDNHLIDDVADYSRVARILAMFTVNENPQEFRIGVPDKAKVRILNNWGSAVSYLGDLKTSVECMDLTVQSQIDEKNWPGAAISLGNSALLALLQGFFPLAKDILKEASVYILKSGNENFMLDTMISNYSALGQVYHALGEVLSAQKYFSKARDILKGPIYSWYGFAEIEHLIQLGKKEIALNKTRKLLIASESNNNARDTAVSYYFLGLLALPKFINETREHLEKLRKWTAKSGDVMCIIFSHMLSAEIALRLDDYSAALTEANTGLNCADGSGFGHSAIELLLILARTNIAIPDYTAGLRFAREALERSQDPDCRYAWGQADGLHLCGVCHKALGEDELARKRLTAAMEIRRKIQHPGLEETSKLLAELMPVKKNKKG